MSEIQLITNRLDTYLVELGEMNGRWTSWLSEMEAAVMGLSTDQLNRVSEAAAGLMDDLQAILKSRTQLLSDAQTQGIVASDLSTLAMRLPAWSQPSMRRAINTARTHIANLKRLHFATWILVHQTSQHYGDVMRVLGRGNPRQDVYIPANNADNEGGQLLDTSS